MPDASTVCLRPRPADRDLLPGHAGDGAVLDAEDAVGQFPGLAHAVRHVQRRHRHLPADPPEQLTDLAVRVFVQAAQRLIEAGNLGPDLCVFLFPDVN